MKKHILVVMTISIVLLLFSHLSFCEEIVFNDNWGEQGFNLVSETKSGVEIIHSIHSMTLETIEINGEEMNTISIHGVFLPNDEGAPNLPGTGKYIAIPQGASPKVEVISYRKEVFNDMNIAPAPNIPFGVDDSPLKYQKDKNIYSIDDYYPSQPVKISRTMKMRGVDVIILGIKPFQYNPVIGELIVYKDVKVKVTFEGGNGHFGEDRLRSRYFEPVLSNNLLNYKSLPSINSIEFSKSIDPRAGECEYIIIVPDDPDFIVWADTIKRWRKMQGILTDVYKITDPEIGSNTVSAIEGFIDDAYNNWTIPPVAVLLLSDYESSGKSYGITSPSYPHPYTGTYVTDNTYADVDGDKLPEMNFARITAQDNADLTVMINKFLDYEQRNPPTDAGYYDHPMVACGWQTERWFQLCTEIVRGFWDYELGKNPVKQYKIYSGSPSVGCEWSTATNTEDVVAYFGSSGLGYIPDINPYTYGEWDSGSEAGINNDINDGSFIIQHRDHGLESGWGEPYYRISSLSDLNNNPLTFVFSINCLTGRFDYSNEVFTEAFHRMNDGAFGLIAASQVSYSFVNDTYIFGLYDGMWPNFDPGNEFSSQQDTFLVNLRPGFASVSGKYYLEASSWPYNTGSKDITYDLFHTHCDAFITLFSEIPDSFHVTHDATVPPGPSNFTVTVMEEDGVTPVEDALVCCWCEVDKAMWVRGHTNSSGQVTLSINPSEPVDSMHVTVTKYNHFRYHDCVSMASGAPSVPTLYNLFNYARDCTTTPTLTFSSTDEEGNQIEYEVHWDTDPAFGSPNTSSTGLYENGSIASFTFPSPLTDGETYYWKVKARDPGGSNYWGGFSEVRSFTIGTSLPPSTCTWYQTTGNQFSDDNLVDVQVDGNSIILPSSGGTVTDTIFEEDFESGALPAGWSVVDGDGDGYTWYVTTTGKADLGGNEPPSAGSYYAYYSDDDMGSGHSTADEYLYSPSCYMGNADSLFLQYGWGFRLYQPGEQLQIRVRFHNGTSWGGWSTVATHSGSGSGNNSINLSSNLPADSVQVLWHYDDGGNWGWATAVDNVIFITKKVLTNTAGSITGTPVVFEELDNVYTRTSWGSVVWDKSTADDSISIQLEYLSGGTWTLVPDGELPGNPSGFFIPAVSCTLSIDALSPATYDTIRLVGNLYRPDGRSLDDPSLLAWEVGNLSELSIFLTEFYAICRKGKVDIHWRTESEEDNTMWLIQRANNPDGNWREIGTLPGQGTKPTPTKYSYTDENVGKDGKYYYCLISIDGEGNREEHGPISVIVKGSIPNVYALHKVHPNPFSRNILIYYDVPKPSHISLKIYNSTGQLVRTLVEGKAEPDYYKIFWDGCNKNGNKVANGTYFLRMDTDSYTKTRKLLFVK